MGGAAGKRWLVADSRGATGAGTLSEGVLRLPASTGAAALAVSLARDSAGARGGVPSVLGSASELTLRVSLGASLRMAWWAALVAASDGVWSAPPSR
jgi:hypothetical protein